MDELKGRSAACLHDTATDEIDFILRKEMSGEKVKKSERRRYKSRGVRVVLNEIVVCAPSSDQMSFAYVFDGVITRIQNARELSPMITVRPLSYMSEGFVREWW